jgi:hypothetical protein
MQLYAEEGVDSSSFKASFPALGDVERPLKLEMRYIVVVDEARNSVVVPTCHHTRWSLLWCKLLLVDWLVLGIWRIAAYHLLVLAKRNALTLELLDVLQAGQDLMLDDESSLHLVMAALLDGEWFALQALKCAGS